MAVVKADGYGHGACTVARAAVAAGVEWLGTTDIVEASELRATGLTVPILTWLNPSGVAAAGDQIAIGRTRPGQTPHSTVRSTWRAGGCIPSDGQ
jgi:alanine racemase